MNKILIAGFALGAIAATGAAKAADLSAPGPVYKAPVMAPVYNWTGFYVGGNVGYSFGRASTDWTIGGAPVGSSSQDMDGILGGLQAGYNWQSSNWVLGLEADIQATGQQGSSSLSSSTPGTPAIPCGTTTLPQPCAPGTGVPAVPGVTGVASTTEKLPWFGTVRARLGVTPSDRWVVYATGGLAYGEVESNGTLVVVGGGNAPAGTNTIRAGWTVGGGIEAALRNNWTAKLEYLYVDLGSVSNNYAGVAPFSPVVTNSHVTDNIVRLGLNYHFYR